MSYKIDLYTVDPNLEDGFKKYPESSFDGVASSGYLRSPQMSADKIQLYISVKNILYSYVHESVLNPGEVLMTFQKYLEQIGKALNVLLSDVEREFRKFDQKVLNRDLPIWNIQSFASSIQNSIR